MFRLDTVMLPFNCFRFNGRLALACGYRRCRCCRLLLFVAVAGVVLFVVVVVIAVMVSVVMVTCVMVVGYCCDQCCYGY